MGAQIASQPLDRTRPRWELRAAKVRMRKANLDRTRFTKCAELGTRVYELANEPARPEGGAPQVLDDDQVTALLQDLGSLDVDLRKAASEILEPDRIEA